MHACMRTTTTTLLHRQEDDGNKARNNKQDVFLRRCCRRFAFLPPVSGLQGDTETHVIVYCCVSKETHTCQRDKASPAPLPPAAFYHCTFRIIYDV